VTDDELEALLGDPDKWIDGDIRQPPPRPREL
jgi:hypothetical protein